MSKCKCPSVYRFGFSTGRMERRAGGSDPYDSDGNLLLTGEVLGGSWKAFVDFLGHKPTDDERDDFLRGYAKGFGKLPPSRRLRRRRSRS